MNCPINPDHNLWLDGACEPCRVEATRDVYGLLCRRFAIALEHAEKMLPMLTDRELQAEIGAMGWALEQLADGIRILRSPRPNVETLRATAYMLRGFISRITWATLAEGSTLGDFDKGKAEAYQSAIQAIRRELLGETL